MDLVRRLKDENLMLKTGVKQDALLAENNELRLELELKNQEVVKLKAQCNYLNNELAFIHTESTLKMYHNSTNLADLDDFSDTDSIASTVTYTESIADSDVTTSNHGSRLPTVSRSSTPVSKPKSTKPPPSASKPGTAPIASRRTSNSSTMSSTSSRRSSATITPPTMSRSKSETAALPQSNSSATITPAATQVLAKRTKRLANELRHMTLAAQDYWTLAENLQAQVREYEKFKGGNDVEALIKASEEAASHKVEILTSKLEKIEKAYEGAEEYINGLEAELVRQETILGQVEKLELDLKAAHEAEEKRTALLHSLEQRLTDQCGNHLQTIAELEAAVAKHKDSTPNGSVPRSLETPQTTVTDNSGELPAALLRAKEAEDKLSFIYASPDTDIDFGGVLVVSQEEFNNASSGGQHGFVHDLMGRFGWSDQETVEDLKARLKKAVDFNSKVKGDVDLLKARIKVLSQQKSPKRSRSVHFGVAMSEVACQSDVPSDTRGPVFELQKMLNEAYAEKDAAAKNHESELSQLQSQYAQSKSSVETLTSEYAAKIAKLEGERIKLQKELLEASLKAEDAQNRVFVLQSQLDKAIKGSPRPVEKELVSPAESQLKAAVAEKEKALKEAEDTILALKREVDAANVSLEDLKCEAAKVPPQVSSSEGSAPAKQATRDVRVGTRDVNIQYGVETRDVQIQNGVATRSVEVQSDVDAIQFARVMSALKSSAKDLKSAHEKVSSLEAKNSDLEKELEGAHSKLNEQEERGRIHQKSISLSPSAAHATVGQEDDEKLMLKAEIADLKTRLAGLQELKSKLLDTATRYHTHDEMTTAVAQIESLTRQIQSLETHEGKVASLSSELAAKDVSLQSALETLEQCKTDLKQMDLELGSTRKEITALQAMLDQSESAAKAVNAMYDASLKGVSELEMRLDEVHRHYDVLIQRILDDGELAIAGLKAQVAALETKNTGLEEGLASAQKTLVEERGAHDGSLADLKKELEATKKSLETSMSELSSCSLEFSECKQKLAETCSKLNDVENLLAIEVKGHDSTKSEYATRVKDLDDEVARLKALHEAEVLAHQATADHSVKERSVTMGSLAVNQAQVDALQSELTELKALHENEVAAHKASIDRSANEIASKIGEYSDRISELEKELDRVKTLHQADADSKMQLLENDLQVAKEALAAEIAKSNEAVAAMEAKLSAVNGTLAIITAEYTAASTECEELRATLEDMKTELDEVEDLLESEIEAHNQTKDIHQAELNSAYDAAKLEVSTLQKELEDVRSHQKITVAETVHEIELRLEQVQKTSDILCGKLVEDNQAIHSLFVGAVEKVSELETRLLAIKQEHEGSITSLKSEVAAARDSHKVASEKAIELESALGTLNIRYSEATMALNADLSACREQHASALDTVKELTASLDAVKKERSEIVNKVDGIRGLHLDASSQAKNLQMELDRTNSQHAETVSRLQNDLRAAQSLLEETIAGRSSAEGRLSKVETEHAAIVDALNSQLKDAVASRTALADQVKHLESQVLQLQDSHDFRIRQISEEHQNTRQRQVTAESKTQDLEATIINLQTEFATTAARLNEEHQATRDLHQKACNEIANLTNQLNSVKDSHANAVADLQAAKKDKTSAELEMRLEQVLKQHHTLMDAVERDHEVLVSKLSGRIDELEKNSTENKSVVSRLENELLRAKDLLAFANGQAARLESLMEKNQAQHQSTVVGLEINNRQLLNDKSDLSQRIQELELQVSTLLGNLEQHMAEHQTTKELHTNAVAKSNDLESAISTLQNGHHEIVTSLQQELQNARGLHTEAFNTVRKLENELEQAEFERSVAVSQKVRDLQVVGEQRMSRVVEELETRLQAVQKQHHILMDSIIKDQEVMTVGFKKELSVLNDGNQSLGKQLSEASELKATYEIRVKDLESSRSILQNELQKQSSEFEVVKSTLSANNQNLLKQYADLCEVKAVLEQRIVSFEDQINGLRDAISSKDGNLGLAKSRITQLESSLLEKQTLIERLESDAKKAAELYSGASDRVRSLETSISEVQRQNSSLVSKFETVQVTRDITASTSERTADLERRLNQSENHRDILIKRLETDAEGTAGLYAAANDRIKELESRLERMHNQYSQLVSGIDHDHKSTIDGFMARISESEKTQTALSLSNLTLEKQCALLTEIKNGNEQRIANLENELRGIRPVLAAKEKELQELSNNHQVSRELHNVANKKLTDLESLLMVARQKFDEVSEKLAGKEKEQKALVDGHQKTRDLHDSAASKILELESMLTVSEQNCRNTVAELNITRNLLATASSKVGQLESQLLDGKKYHETFISRLESARDLHLDAQTQVVELTERLKSVEAQYDVLVGKLVEDHVATVSFLQVQLAAASNEVDSTKLILDKKCKSLEIAEKGVLALRELSARQVDVTEHTQKVSRLQSRVMTLENQLSLSQAAVGELTEKLRNGERDAESLKNLWCKLDEEVDLGRKKSVEITRLEERINELLSQIATSRDNNPRMSELEAKVSTVTAQYDTEKALHQKALAALDHWKGCVNSQAQVNKDKQIELDNLRYQFSMMLSEKESQQLQFSTEVNQLKALVLSLEAQQAEYKEKIDVLSRNLTSVLAQADQSTDNHSKAVGQYASELRKSEALVNSLRMELSQTVANYVRLQSEMSDVKHSYETELASERGKSLQPQFELQQRQISSTIETLGATTSRSLGVIDEVPEPESGLEGAAVAQSSHQLTSELNAESTTSVTSKDVQVTTTTTRATTLATENGTDGQRFRSLYEATSIELMAEKEKSSLLQKELADLRQSHLSTQSTITATTTTTVSESADQSPLISTNEIAESGELTGREVATSRKVRVLTPQESTIFSAFKHVSDEHWNLISQELIEKNDRIKELEEKLELVAAIPEILKKWEETFVEQEADIEQLEKELSETQDELKRVRDAQTETLLPTGQTVSERSIKVDEHTHTETVLLHPEFETVSLELEQKNLLIVDLQFRLEKLSAIPDILKSWEDAFKAQEADIDQLEAELDAAHGQIQKLQSTATTTIVNNTRSTLSDSNDSAVDLMSHRLSPPYRDLLMSPNSTFVQSAGSTPRQLVSESFEIAYNRETGEYYLPDSNSFGHETSNVGALQYIEVLRQHIYQLERNLSESRSRIMNLQSQVSNLELANSEASLRVSRARTELIEVNTANRLLESRLARVKDRSICGIFNV
ncbi:hypothetical protein BDR26DRAFT_43763 [Obelidium mucronatum]|nr:hypothetical protein BDR26DRAFT_43763 [Obelidium mucronatum]